MVFFHGGFVSACRIPIVEIGIQWYSKCEGVMGAGSHVGCHLTSTRAPHWWRANNEMRKSKNVANLVESCVGSWWAKKILFETRSKKRCDRSIFLLIHELWFVTQVVRLNRAPTAGYEEHVGSNTTFRLMPVESAGFHESQQENILYEVQTCSKHSWNPKTVLTSLSQKGFSPKP